MNEINITIATIQPTSTITLGMTMPGPQGIQGKIGPQGVPGADGIGSITELINDLVIDDQKTYSSFKIEAIEQSLSNDINVHKSNNVIHISQTDRDKWNGKVDTIDVYTKAEVNGKLTAKADSISVYDKATVDTNLALKAEKTTTYTKTETETKLSFKVDSSTIYDITTIDGKLATKADSSSVYDKTLVYTKTETETKLAFKADITTIYDRATIDTKLSLKADSATIYDKATIDGKLNAGVLFVMSNLVDNAVSAPYYFESNRTINKIRFYATDSAGALKVPSANTIIELYKNGSLLNSITFSTSTISSTVSLSVLKDDIIYAKINGSVNGLTSISIQLTCVLV